MDIEAKREKVLRLTHIHVNMWRTGATLEDYENLEKVKASEAEEILESLIKEGLVEKRQYFLDDEFKYYPITSNQ